MRARVGEEGEDEEVLAQKFLDAVDQLNDDLGIPTHLDALQEADIPALAKAACAEGNTYPVPRYMTQQQCEAADPPGAAARARARRQEGARAAQAPRLKPHNKETST